MHRKTSTAILTLVSIRLAIFAVMYTTVINAEANNLALPPVTVPEGQLSGLEHVVVDEFIIRGNTVISDEEIFVVTTRFIGRELNSRDLFELKNEITNLYIDKGYLTSGALLPDQKITDGRVEFQIIEGALSSIQIRTNGRLRERFIRSRIEDGINTPLNVIELQEPLRRLQQNSLIKRVDTQLSPGMKLGESVLRVTTEEADPISSNFVFNNHRSPSIGSYRGELGAAYKNITGWGEVLGGSYGLTEGLDDYSVFLTIPVTRSDTTLTFRYQANDSTVITRDFDDLDIDSDTDTYGIELRHPLLRRGSKEFALTLTAERKKSETFLLGQPFSFSQGVVNGVSRVSVLGIGGEWIDRTEARVVTCRSQLNVGINALDATIQKNAPDGEFTTWLTQFQSLHRLHFRNSEILARGALRLSSNELLPLEKFPIGGRDTVRGYRENELTRDNGFLFGLEFRLPVGVVKLPGVSRSPVDGRVQLALFSDYGVSWDDGSGSSEPPDIGSVGVGFRWFPGKSLHAELYVGHALRKLTGDDEHDLQDDGIHFEIGVNIF